jgi:hypothetical protein
MQTTYAVHLHINGTNGMATFPTMTEAMLYMIELVVDLIAAHPQIADADWIDDDNVCFVGHNNEILGTASLRMETLH